MHDVFISYSSKNKEIADAICHHLEAQEIKCWYAPRDIKSGDTWASAIVRAIAEAKIFVLIYSEESNRSEHVLREISHAANKGCIIIPFRLEDTRMNDDLSYYLQSVHWLDAIDPPMKRNLDRLASHIRALLDTPQPQQPKQETPVKSTEQKKPGKKKKGLAVLAALLAVVCVLLLFAPDPEPAPDNSLSGERKPEDTVMELEMQALSVVKGYRYPFYSTTMFTEEKDQYFMEDIETGTLSLVKTDTGFRTIKDLEYDCDKLVMMGMSAHGDSPIIYFMELDSNTVKIYNRLSGEWINREGIQLPLTETESISMTVYNRASITAGMDHSGVLGVILWDSELQGLSRILYMQSDGSYSDLDISSDQLKEIILGIDRTDMDCMFALDQDDRLKVLDVEHGQVLDLTHEQMVEEYLPYAAGELNRISPNKQYLHLTKYMDQNKSWQEVIWDLHTGQVVFNETFSRNHQLFFSGDHEILCYNCEDYSLRSCDLKTGQKKLLLNAEYFEEENAFSGKPFAFWYAPEFETLFFSCETAGQKENHWINTLVMTDLEGRVLAKSGDMELRFGAYTPELVIKEGMLLYILNANDLTKEYENGIYSDIYRSLYYTDETGTLVFSKE